MPLRIFIRKENKNRWERRTPLTPKAVARLSGLRIPISVEKSPYRIYPDRAYENAGAPLVDHCGPAQVVLGIKEPDLEAIQAGQIHIAFSHTIKGQCYNMGLLQRFIDARATLIDYETMRDSDGARLIAFGRYAGVAGAVDSLHVTGKKLALQGRPSTFGKIQQTWRYDSLAFLEQSLSALRIGPQEPRIVIVGTGNVGRGAEEVCRWLRMPKIEAAALHATQPPPGNWYTVLGTADIVAHKHGKPYDMREYREYGAQRYTSSFDRYLGKFDILLQTPYWDPTYPCQLSRSRLLRFKDQLPMVIGDISCDIAGSLACTLAETTIDEPAFTYQPEEHSKLPGISWDGPTIMAIDHLPCELSKDASEHFSRILEKYLPEIARMDLGQALEDCGLTPAMRDAVIVYKGALTAPYRYLQESLVATG